MVGYIYKWENNINGKCYIGQTMNKRGYNERWSQHICNAEKNICNNKFYNAIRKYGHDNFSKNILEKIEVDNIFKLKNILDEKEIHYINKFDSFNQGYNSTLGGDFNVWNSNENLDRNEILLKIKETRARNELEKSNKIKTGVKLCKSIVGMKAIYDDFDVKIGKSYSYYYKPIKKGNNKSYERDFNYSKENGNIKIYYLDGMVNDEIESSMKRKCEYKLINDMDLMDENIVKELIKLDIDNLNYIYDIDDFLHIKECIDFIKSIKLEGSKEIVFKMINEGYSQKHIKNTLGITQASVSAALCKAAKIMSCEYEKEYEENHYYLNLVKGKYKTCSKCGEIKLLRYFDKNGRGGNKNSCKSCNKNKIK